MKSKSTAPVAFTKNLKPKMLAKPALKDLTPKHDPKGGMGAWVRSLLKRRMQTYVYVY